MTDHLTENARLRAALAWAGHNEWFSSDPKHLAERAYLMADAMIAARGDHT